MEEVTKPSASTEVVDAAAAQSQGTRAWKTIETTFLPTLLNTPAEADVLRPVPRDVDGDVAEHVEADVQIEKEVVDNDDAVDIAGKEAQPKTLRSHLLWREKEGTLALRTQSLEHHLRNWGQKLGLTPCCQNR